MSAQHSSSHVESPESSWKCAMKPKENIKAKAKGDFTLQKQIVLFRNNGLEYKESWNTNFRKPLPLKNIEKGNPVIERDRKESMPYI